MIYKNMFVVISCHWPSYLMCVAPSFLVHFQTPSARNLTLLPNKRGRSREDSYRSSWCIFPNTYGMCLVNVLMRSEISMLNLQVLSFCSFPFYKNFLQHRHSRLCSDSNLFHCPSVETAVNFLSCRTAGRYRGWVRSKESVSLGT